MITLFAICYLLSAINVDWAVFKYADELSLVEVYYSCPYNLFQYVQKNDTIYASYKVSFYLKSIDSPDSLQDIFNKRAIIPSFEIAAGRNMKLVDGFGFFARPGKFLFKLAISDSESTQLISLYGDTVEVPEFSDSPVLSDILLASSVIPDTTGGKFSKGKMKIIPNPELSFGKAYELLYAYIEGYNLVNDTFGYELFYRILSSKRSIVKSFPAEVKHKTNTSFAYTFAISTKGLKPGQYILEVNLLDRSTGKNSVKEKPFHIIPKISEEYIPALLFDTLNYAKEIKFLATTSELNQYNSLNENGKQEFLRKFWQKHNLEEFTKRLKYADDKYTLGRVPGRETDRGRIYIKYGPPDEVVVHTMVEHVKPHEHWYYYSRGFHFVFIDIRSNNDFQLIYSNTDAEPTNPNWEKYIDPLELDDLK